MYMEVENGRPRGRPRKTREVVKDDMKGLGLASADARDCHAWGGRLYWGHVLIQVCLRILPTMSEPLNGVCC